VFRFTRLSKSKLRQLWAQKNRQRFGWRLSVFFLRGSESDKPPASTQHNVGGIFAVQCRLDS